MNLRHNSDGDRVGQRGFDAGRLEGGEQGLGAGPRSAVQLAEDDARSPARVADHPGFLDDREDVGRAPDDGPGAQPASQDLLGVDAVLQRDDDGVPAHHRRDGGGRRLGVVELDGEQNNVDRTDAPGIVGGLEGMDARVAERALDPEAGGAHGLQVRAAGDEGNLGAGAGQAGAEIAADTARPHDGEAKGGVWSVGHGAIITRSRARVNGP